jgi:hypothetical protein
VRASPFLFLNEPKNVELLFKQLRELDVDVQRVEDSGSAYQPATISLTHASIGTFDIVFHRSWWPDGLHQEDGKVCFSTGSAETLICDVRQMLRLQFDKPLSHVIIDKVTEAVARLVQRTTTEALSSDTPAERFAQCVASTD